MPADSKHHIGSLIPDTSRLSEESGRGQARIGPWAGAGLLAGGCLGCGYGLLVGVIGGFAVAVYCGAIGGTIGLIAGPPIGFLIGLAQVLLRQTAIPVPVIAAAVTEFILLPPQLLAAGAPWQPAAVVFIYIPSVLGIGAAVVLGFLLPPAKHPLHNRGKPDGGLPLSPDSTQPFGVTGLRLRAYGRWRYRRSSAHFLFRPRSSRFRGHRDLVCRIHEKRGNRSWPAAR